MTLHVRHVTRVFSDTSVFCNVAGALGGDGLIRLLDYLDTRVVIVREVHRELTGLTLSRFPDLEKLKTVAMIGEFLREPPLALDTDLAADVSTIVEHLGLFTADPERPRKNYGEVATVLAAARLHAPALMDDAAGRKFARLRDVPCVSTRELVIQMHAEDALSADEAYAIWNVAASGHRDRDAFDQAIEDATSC